MTEHKGTLSILLYEEGGFFTLGIFVAGLSTFIIGYFAWWYYGPQIAQFLAIGVGVGAAFVLIVIFFQNRAMATGRPHMELRIAGHSPKDVWYSATNDPDDPTDYVVEDEPGIKTGLRRVRIVPLLDPADFTDIYPDMPAMSDCLYIAIHYWGEWNQRIGRGGITAIYKTFPFYCEQSESIACKAFYGVSPEQIKDKFGPMPHLQMISTTYGDAAVDMEPFNDAQKEIAAREALNRMGIVRPRDKRAYDVLKSLKEKQAELLKAAT